MKLRLAISFSYSYLGSSSPKLQSFGPDYPVIVKKEKNIYRNLLFFASM